MRYVLYTMERAEMLIEMCCNFKAITPYFVLFEFAKKKKTYIHFANNIQKYFLNLCCIFMKNL